MSDLSEIIELIMSFPNKKTSLNNVWVPALKKMGAVSQKLSNLFNKSVTLEIFPDELKVGTIIPFL